MNIEDCRQTAAPERKGVEETMRVVVFNLCGHEHAVDLSMVKEILQAPEDISPVIEAPDFVDGVINLRGRTVPVVNLRRRLKLPETNQAADASSIIVVRHDQQPVGIRVDSVMDLLTISPGMIETPTELIAGIRMHFIKGVIYLADRFLVFLDIDTVFSVGDYKKINLAIENVPAADDVSLPKAELRKIVAFELDQELYGADVDNVVEIIRLLPFMPLPNVSGFMLGLINIRGDILPVIDLRELFRLGKGSFGEDTRIIVMQSGIWRVCVVVDRVWELLRLAPEAFQAPPADVTRIDEVYSREIAAVDNRLLIVLDIDRILSETAGDEAGWRSA